MLWRAPVILCQLRSGFARKGAALTIHELRVRSNEFVANLDLHLSAVIEHNEQLLQLNKGQLQSSQTSEGKPLINSRTGSAKYSPAYAKRKGYSDPDLFLTGRFYKEMDILFKEPDEYFITDYADVTKYLVEMYGEDIFGIRDKVKAKRIVVPLFANRYRQFVLA